MADPREVVVWFGQQMEHTLAENDWKGGWEGMEDREILSRLAEEYDELFDICQSDPTTGIMPAAPKDIIKEATDVANFAMFLADNVARRSNLREVK